MNAVLRELDDVAELPEMTAAELKAQREYLGLSTQWIAETLVIGQRRIERMEAGREDIPHVIVSLIDEAQAEAKMLVQQYTAVCRRKVKAAAGASVLLPTYRTDKSSAAEGLKYPSRWYRHIAARVADACPGAILDFFPEREANAAGNDQIGRVVNG